MSIPSLALRPAVDARPPADQWSGFQGRLAETSPHQPALRLVDVETEGLLSAQPTPPRLPVRIDLSPAGVDPCHTSELEDQARTCAPWFAQLLVEALDGRRSLEPLGRWLDDWVLAEVSRRVRARRRLRTPSSAAPPPGRTTVVSLRAQLAQPRVLEVSAHLRQGPRSTAMAFRLVRSGRRWRCTELALAP